MRFDIYKIFVRLLCCFIPLKRYRKSVRNKLFALNSVKVCKCKNYYASDKFFASCICEKSVLIVEFNDFHGVTLPGYIHYFSKLGYNVDLFLREGQNVFEKPLCRVTDPYRVFYGNEEKIKKMLISDLIKKYDFVFFNTTFYYGYLGDGRSVFDILGKIPAGKYGTLMIEHNLEPYVERFDETKYITEGTLFTLLGFRNTKMLSSSYIGNVKITEKNKNKTTFLVIGSIYSGSRNYKMLIDSCQTLLNKGIYNFQVIIIGAGHLDGVPQKLNTYIKVLGRVDYVKMYNEIEKGDFILTLFDPSVDEHKKYLDNWASGTSILSYAFLKPCLIDRFFARSYFMSEENAVLYQGDLEKAMEKSISMLSDKYKSIQQNLQCTVASLQSSSRENLDRQLEKMKNEYENKL